MDKKYIFLFLLVGLIILNVLFFIDNERSLLTNKYVFTTNNEKKLNIRQEDKYKILVYVPNTEYPLLNDVINKKINSYINQFKKDSSLVVEELNQYYTLIILYDVYEYKDYISYVFRIEYYIGGAHPSHEIWTVSYDKKEENIVDISSLEKMNPSIFNIFSSISREELLHNKRIPDSKWLMEGTIPVKDNFSNFAFSDNGLLLFFPRYQIAPYSAGEFIVRIPYDKIF